MLCSLNAGGFLLFCTYYILGSPNVMGWDQSQLSLFRKVLCSYHEWLNGWSWFHILNKSQSPPHLKLSGKDGKKWLPSFTSAQFQASVPFIASPDYCRICCISKVIREELAWKQMLHRRKCLSPVGGSLKCSTDKPSVTDLHPGGFSVDAIWKRM